jgi:hypothetical protein
LVKAALFSRMIGLKLSEKRSRSSLYMNLIKA